jgi:hypothetical protein
MHWKAAKSGNPFETPGNPTVLTILPVQSALEYILQEVIRHLVLGALHWHWPEKDLPVQV